MPRLSNLLNWTPVSSAPVEAVMSASRVPGLRRSFKDGSAFLPRSTCSNGLRGSYLGQSHQSYVLFRMDKVNLQLSLGSSSSQSGAIQSQGFRAMPIYAPPSERYLLRHTHKLTWSFCPTRASNLERMRVGPALCLSIPHLWNKWLAQNPCKHQFHCDRALQKP